MKIMNLIKIVGITLTAAIGLFAALAVLELVSFSSFTDMVSKLLQLGLLAVAVGAFIGFIDRAGSKK